MFEKIFNKRDTKGITLIALVITIIVLLILAGVAINSIMSQDGAPDKAAQARLENRRGEAKDAASVIVTGLVQDYYDKKFVQRATEATSAGDYVMEVLDEGEKTDGTYFVSLESDILQVADEDDVLATGVIEDDGVITWDGTPRAITVNPWNNLANESEVAPADLFYYQITEEPVATGKVDGVEEKAKVADNSETIKVADTETENLGKATITGINVEKLASFYSESDYNKTYNYSDYNGDSWYDFFHKYYDANVVGDYHYSDSSGTYYYNVPGSGRLDLSVDSSDIDNYESSSYSIRTSRLWDILQYADLDAFIESLWNRNSYWLKSDYSYSVVNKVYENNSHYDDNGVYWDNYPTNDESELHEVYRCTSDYYESGNNVEDIKSAIRNYVEEHAEQFTYLYAESYCADDHWETVYYEEDDSSYFTTNSFSPYFIADYNTTPTCFNKFVIPHIYEENGKKYEITKIDFSNKYGSDLVIPYVGDKISKFYIPNSVTSIDFGYGEDDYRKTISLDTILIPGGLGDEQYGVNYFDNGINVNKVVFGEGITSINASGLRWHNVTDVYLPKSLTNITGNWDNNINVHYAGRKGAWSRVTGNKPNVDKVTVRSRYSD